MIGARMRERRDELRMTQAELADALPGRVQGADVSRWENGKHRPRSDTLEHIAAALDTTMADLIAGPHAERGVSGEAPPLDEVLGRLDVLEEALHDLRVSLAGEEVERAERTEPAHPQRQARNGRDT